MKKTSFAVRVSLKFTLVLAAAMLILALAFVLLTESAIRNERAAELEAAYKGLAEHFSDADGLDFTPSLPYYIEFAVYDEESGEMLDSNDPFLPMLAVTGGKARHYISRNFFIDGDLNILYFAERIPGKSLVIETAIDMENDASSRSLRMLPRIILLSIPPILLLAFFVALLITKNTMNSVLAMTRAAEKISSSNLESLLPVSGNNDEIDHLADTFNRLFIRLKKDFEREKEFTGNVSHELKTPLAVILGHVNLLLRWGKNDVNQTEASLNAIKTEAKSMEAIIQNLLQLSRLEGGKITPEYKTVAAIPLLNRLREETLCVAPETEFTVESENISFRTDEELLHQVLTALVSNSLKFCPSPCKIWLRCSLFPGKIVIEEEDDGPGFSQTVAEHAFERFFRGDEAHSRKNPGAGLGLSIASSVVSTLGGTISLQNSDSGGALLRLVLPEQPPASE